MLNAFLERLTPNFSNIEDVYNQLLKVYNPDNINTTELTFIQSVSFENAGQSENILKLSMYLGKKTSNVKFHNIDYYNHYLKTKRFGFTLPLTYSTKQIKSEPFTTKIEFNEFLNILNDYKQRYEYIFNKLSNVDKSEFKNDFCDQLKKNKQLQTESKFKEAIKDLIKFINIISEVPKQNKEIDIYIKSYNQYHFDEVANKRKEDGTPNNIYLGNNFNEWLKDIDRNLLANKSYDAEIQDKLSTYNKYLLFLVQDLIRLYKGVSGYEKTKNTGYNTRLKIDEKPVLQRIKSIKFYAEIVKHYTRNKQFQKAKDIKDYCIALFDNCVYNLNDVLTIDIYKSPLKTHFEDVKTDLKNSINFEELSLINQLEIKPKPIKQETNILLKLNLQIDYFYKRLCLGNILKLKENFLVCSDEPLFDIEKLKQYFIDNSLNDFAKNELKKLIELINDFEIKRNEYFLIPNPNPLIFYQYEYVNSKGGKSSGSVSAKLEYFHYTDNIISHLLEIGFKNKSNNSEYFESLTVDKIYFKCIEIREVCKIMMQPQQTESDKSDELYKTENWFVIGLLFANGEMDKLLQKHNRNGTQIAKELGNEKGFRPYITESIGVKKKTASKSIFSSKEKMDKIILHCESLNIPVISDFTKALPLE